MTSASGSTTRWRGCSTTYAQGVSDLDAMTARLLALRREREWEQFHNAKDQIVSLNLEAAELLELTQVAAGRGAGPPP